MSRNGIDNPHISALDREVPLPTYDEAVGGSCLSNLKNNVLVPSSSDAQDNRNDQQPGMVNRNNGEGEYNRRRDNTIKTKLIMVALGFVVLPMCIMIIVLQIKVCGIPHLGIQNENDKMTAVHQACIKENIFLRNRYDDLCKQLEQTPTSIDSLNLKIVKLQEEVRKLRSITSLNASSKAIISNTENTTTDNQRATSSVKTNNRNDNLIILQSILDQISNQMMPRDEILKIDQNLTSNESDVVQYNDLQHG